MCIPVMRYRMEKQMIKINIEYKPCTTESWPNKLGLKQFHLIHDEAIHFNDLDINKR